MSADPDLPQDPGIPGPKVPEELPPEGDEGSAPRSPSAEPEVEGVPDSDLPDYDEEGSRSPSGEPSP